MRQPCSFSTAATNWPTVSISACWFMLMMMSNSSSIAATKSITCLPISSCRGQPVSAHWGVEDPAAVEGSDDDKRQGKAEAMAAMRAEHERLKALSEWYVQLLAESLGKARDRQISAAESRVATGQGILRVLRLQRPGGKMLPAGELRYLVNPARSCAPAPRRSCFRRTAPTCR